MRLSDGGKIVTLFITCSMLLIRPIFNYFTKIGLRSLLLLVTWRGLLSRLCPNPYSSLHRIFYRLLPCIRRLSILNIILSLLITLSLQNTSLIWWWRLGVTILLIYKVHIFLVFWQWLITFELHLSIGSIHAAPFYYSVRHYCVDVIGLLSFLWIFSFLIRGVLFFICNLIS